MNRLLFLNNTILIRMQLERLMWVTRATLSFSEHMSDSRNTPREWTEWLVLEDALLVAEPLERLD